MGGDGRERVNRRSPGRGGAPGDPRLRAPGGYPIVLSPTTSRGGSGARRGDGVRVLIGVPPESRPGETRVAATPATVGQLIALGYEVVVEAGAGAAAQLPRRGLRRGRRARRHGRRGLGGRRRAAR